MTKKWHGGKGSTAREGSYSKQFKDNWDKIFGSKEKKVVPVLEKTYRELALENYLVTKKIMDKLPTHREWMEKEGKQQIDL